MHRRGQKTTFQERVLMSELATAGRTDLEIADTLSCLVWTVGKWQRLFQRKGRVEFLK